MAEGEISELHVGLKGTMNALFLKDLAQKTHRGIRGRVEDGKSGGGLCYGYKVIKKLDARGDPIRGDREIDPNEANVVRRIFKDFAAGVGPRAIARTLNDESVPGPNGKPWIDTTIRGHVQRGTLWGRHAGQDPAVTVRDLLTLLDADGYGSTVN